METCFVIQPFDGDKFDKRYDDVLVGAIENCKLEPYRVDRDPASNVIMESVENGIKNARICIAEITTDNPNVWFELGYALASQKEVVIICSSERMTNYPFDIQHRNIIKYNPQSKSDFEKLAKNVEDRIKAILLKEDEIQKLSVPSPIAETEGLSQVEVVTLVSIMQNQLEPTDSVSANFVKSDVTKAGFTDLAASIGLRSLLRKGMTESFQVTADGPYDGVYYMYRVTETGAEWLEQNQHTLVLRKPAGDSK